MKNKKTIITIIVILIIVICSLIKNIFKPKVEIYENTTSNELVADENFSLEEASVSEKIKVHIIGEIKNPGLIELDSGSRVQDAIDLAGGLTENADISKTNLAYILSDGEKIKIPNVNDEESGEMILNSNKKININTATISELESIPGIGEATANSIVEYRSKFGKFATIEDIQNVSGIGNSKFEKMKDYISVK